MAHRDAAAEYFIDINSSGSKPDGGSLVIPDSPSIMLLQFHLSDLLAKSKLNVYQALNMNKALCRA